MICVFKLILLIILSIIFRPFERDCALSASITSTWDSSSCQTKPLSIVELPNDDYFGGGILELLDIDLFGPALYWRSSLYNCSHQFAIPLPFSARSFAYTSQHFYLVRDDVDIGQGNLYSISDFNLIGGYVYWLTKSEEQAVVCDENEIPLSFNFDESVQNFEVVRNSTSTPLCSVDFDRSFAVERISLNLSSLQSFGDSKFQKLYEKFLLINSIHNVSEKAWIWTSWLLYQGQPDRFVSIQSIAYMEDYAIGIQPNFRVAFVPVYPHGDQNAIYNNLLKDGRFISVTTFYHLNTMFYLAIALDQSVYVMYHFSDISVKVGTAPEGIREMFIISNSIVIGLHVTKQMTYYKNYIADVVLPATLCNEGMYLTSFGCISTRTINQSLSNDTAVEECQKENLAYKGDSSTADMEIIKTTEWISFSTSRRFYIGRDKVSHAEAVATCEAFSNDLERARLAVIDTGDLHHLMSDKIVSALGSPTPLIELWIGASMNANGQWMWTNGRLVNLPPKMSYTTHPISAPQNESGSFDFETTTAASTGTKSSVIFTPTGINFWGYMTDENFTTIREPAGSGECLALGNLFTNVTSFWWRTRNCSYKAFYVCEKYRICWDLFPNTQAIPSDVSSQINSFLLNSTTELKSASDCAELCQAQTDPFCNTFTLHQNESTLSYECYGSSQHRDFATGEFAVGSTSGIERACATFSLSLPKSIEYYGDCEPRQLYRRPVPSLTTRSTCEAAGHCYFENDHFPACSEKKLSGPIYTSDGWLMSIYSSYEYVVLTFGDLPHITSMHGARQQCRSEGGDIAYVGFSNEVEFSYLQRLVLNIPHYHLFLWTGVTDTEEESNFVSLDGKQFATSLWHQSEPNGDNHENCALFVRSLNKFYDVPCSQRLNGRTYGVLCQRLSAECDVAGKVKIPCGDSWSENIDKYDCVARGCCYEETLDGQPSCYRSPNKDTSNSLMTVDQQMNWFVPSSGHFEYWLGSTAFGNIDDARAACWEHGADLAYSEILQEELYRDIESNLLQSTSSSIWLGLIRSNDSNNQYVGMNGESGWYDWAPGEPARRETEICVAVHVDGKWHDVYCRAYSALPLCQRWIQVDNKYSSDGWLMSIYSSYEYVVLLLSNPTITSMQQARDRCIAEGGDIAYVGFSNEVEFSYLQRFVLKIAHDLKFIWTGVTDIEEESNFVSLDGKQFATSLWHPGEPNGDNNTNCATFVRSLNKFYNVPCSFGVNGRTYGVLCQRLSAECDVPGEVKMPCGASWSENITKYDCVSRGCCYEETLDGQQSCYRSPNKDTSNSLMTVDQQSNWFVPSSGHFEYWLGSTEFDNVDDARAACWEHGADLAYSEILQEELYRDIESNLLQSTSSGIWLGLKRSKDSNQYVGMNGESGWYDWSSTEPTRGETTFCVVVAGHDRKWHDVDCSGYSALPLCQRWIQVDYGDCEPRQLYRRPVPSLTTRSTCKAAGHCYFENDHFPACSEKKPSGPIYTSDGWLMSIYSSYEYVVLTFGDLPHITSVHGARQQCRSEGGDIAYVGFSNEVEFSFLQRLVLSIPQDLLFIWLGVNDIAQEGNFVSLDGKQFPESLWYEGQPDGNNYINEDCVVLKPDLKKSYDHPCDNVVDGFTYGVLCQRLSAECDVPGEVKISCGGSWSKNINKYDCVSRGCCYEETLDGQQSCYRSRNRDNSNPLMTVDQQSNWFVPSSGHFEYWLGSTEFDNVDDARAACWEHGADLAYSEILKEEIYRDIENRLLQSTSSLIWLGLMQSTVTNQFVGMNGESGWSYWAPGQPEPGDAEACVVAHLDRKWHDVYCSGYFALPLCQRWKLDTKYTSDGWLMSIYSSYQYIALIFEALTTIISMQGARDQCRLEGGDIAYVGFSNEVEFSYLQRLVLSVSPDRLVIWLGVTDIEEEGNFVSLDGKQFPESLWYPGEPNGANINEDCVVLKSDHKKSYDHPCDNVVDGFTYGVLCQRLSAECDVASEVKMPCGDSWSKNITKYDCVSRGCCYEETLDGQQSCYRSPNKDASNPLMTVDQQSNWFVPSSGHFEYWLGSTEFDNVDDARAACWDHGADLAYSEILKEEIYRDIESNLLQSTSSSIWLGLIRSNDSNNQYVGMNGESGWYDWAPGEPARRETEFCMAVHVDGKWHDVYCSGYSALPLCQRWVQVEFWKSETRIACHQETSDTPICDKYGSTCSDNATCVELEGSYDCICWEGFTGNGKTCYPLSSCPDEWSFFHTGCYRLVENDNISFFQAELDCQNRGAHLLAIHSIDEETNIQELLGNVPVSHVWLGLRLNLALSKARWTDESQCDYKCSNISASSGKAECFYFRSDNATWVKTPCAAKLRDDYSMSVRLGYVCKIDINQGTFFQVDMAAYPWDYYPGFAEMSINGIPVQFEYDDDDNLEVGCFNAASLNRFGRVLSLVSICTENVSSLNAAAQTFLAHIFAPEVSHFALATGGQLMVRDRWISVYDEFEKNEFYLPRQDLNLETSATTSVDPWEWQSNLADNDSILLKCGSNVNNRWCTAAMYKGENELPLCRTYAWKDDVSPNIYVHKLIGEDIRLKATVKYRSKTFKTSFNESNLTCPWMFTKVRHSKVRSKNIVEFHETTPPKVSFQCSDPPCVLQLACTAPFPPPMSTNQFSMLGSALLLCEKNDSDLYNCPINETGYIFDASLQASRKFPSYQHRRDVLVTFDDLLHLGSPPYELESLQEPGKLLWRPLMWQWLSDSYGKLVTGVLHRAIRFRGQVVYTSGDLCWGKLGDVGVCSNEMTATFWMRVVKWPIQDAVVVLNSGGSSKHASCHGFAVYITADHEMIIRLKTGNKNWRQNVALQHGKWTHVWFHWNPINESIVLIDGEIATNSSANYDFSGDSKDCTNDFRIGSLRKDVELDFDHLVLFNKALTKEETDIILDAELPFRRRWIGNGNGLTLEGGKPCAKTQALPSRACGLYQNKCPGSAIYCKMGFTFSFTLKVMENHTTSGSYGPIALVSKLPLEVMSDTPYSVNVYGIKEDWMWMIKVYHTMTSNSAPEHLHSETIEPGEKIPFWVQYHSGGKFTVCIKRIDHCIQHSVLSIEDVTPEMYKASDSYPLLYIGPSLLTSNNSGTYEEQDQSIEMTDVWFIEQALDVVVAADEMNVVSSPIHWQVRNDGLQTTDGTLPFLIRGDTDKTNVTHSDMEYNKAVGLWNQLSNYNDAVTVWHRYSWLELEAGDISSSCLEDISTCAGGFTLQFWIKTSECDEKVALGDCYYVSTGAQASPASRGFSFYRSVADDMYHVLVATTLKRWKLTFEADFSTRFFLVRISWEEDAGLNVFLDDQLFLRTSQWVSVLQLEEPYTTGNFDPFRSFTIGKRNDNFSGFSAFEIGEIVFWEGLVEGTPFQSIGGSCMSGWTQIGESCYRWMEQSATFEDAARTCSQMKASLPHPSSLSAHLALERYLAGSTSTFWLGLEADANDAFRWSSLQSLLTNWSFQAFEDADMTTMVGNGAFYAKNLLAWPKSNWVWQPAADGALSGVVCVTPLIRDPYLRGCTQGVNENLVDELYEIRSSPTVTLGSYDSSHSCRRLCRSVHDSTVTAVSTLRCYCFKKTVELQDINPISSTSACANQTAVDLNVPMVQGYSELIYSASSNYNEQLHCGSLEYGGAYKCGKNGATLHAAIYDLDGGYSEPVSQAPLSSLVISREGDNLFEILETVYVLVKSFYCCEVVLHDVEGDDNCNCSEPVRIKVDYGDGHVYETYINPNGHSQVTLEHFYESPGTYTIYAEAINRPNSTSVPWSTQLEVLRTIQTVLLDRMEQDPTQPDLLSRIDAIAKAGEEMHCRWNYGDGSPEEEVYVEALPIPPAYHRYQQPGFYPVRVSCKNRLSEDFLESNSTVQVVVRDLVAPTEQVVKLGETFRYSWSVPAGSQVDCRVFFGNFSLPESDTALESNHNQSSYYFDRDSNTGHANVATELYAPDFNGSTTCLTLELAVTYPIVLTCYNSVTDTPPVAVAYITFEVPIEGVTLHDSGNKTFLVPDEDFCLELEISLGSNIIVQWEFNDESHPEKDISEVCGTDECNYRYLCSSYSIPGQYNVIVTAMNSFGVQQSSFKLSFENIFRNIEIQTTPSISPADPSSISFTHQHPLPSGYMDVCFGDGNCMSLFSEFNKSEGTIEIQHSYLRIGFYNITCFALNNVSSVNASAVIQIGKFITGERLSLVSSRFLKTNIDSATVEIAIDQGSEPLYELDFGDGSTVMRFGENSSREEPNKLDLHVIGHVYKAPGTYTMSVNISNVFNAVVATSSQSVTVQNPLAIGSYSLVPLTDLAVPYPMGFAILDAKLVSLADGGSANNSGWANDVYIEWEHVERSSILLNDYGSHETDLFPVNFTFNREDIGDVTVRARLHNLVSSLELTYQFQVREVVTGMELEVSNIEAPQPSIIASFQNGQTVYCSVAHLLRFKLSVADGSHLVYHINYGDNSTESNIPPVIFGSNFVVDFSHQYLSLGSYDLAINVTNSVSEVTKSFAHAVIIFERVSDPEISAKYVDIDAELNNVDIFRELSEIYALAYGKPGFDSQTNLPKFPLNRAVTFHAGIHNGTNVTTTWMLQPENVAIQISRNDNGNMEVVAAYNGSGTLDFTDNLIESNGLKLKTLRILSKEELENIGLDFAEKLEPAKYVEENSILVQYQEPGEKTITVTVHNEVSHAEHNISFALLSAVEAITFGEVEPPIANRTSNITFTIQPLGTDSCFFIDLGDYSEPIAFGASGVCIDAIRQNTARFLFLTVENALFAGRNYSSYEYDADLLKGTGSLTFTLSHTYLQPGVYKVQVAAGNLLSSQTATLDLTVTEILCDYPTVTIEKHSDHSIKKPRRTWSFLRFRLYSSFKLDCKLTSKISMRWDAYNIIPAVKKTGLNLVNEDSNSGKYTSLPQSAQMFESPEYHLREVQGLQFTSKSEDIAIPARFFAVGQHLICVNVAMVGVESLNSSDCIYLEIALPPLVAAIKYGVRRTVGYQKFVIADAASASYDPDKKSQANEDDLNQFSGLSFDWSCPFLLDDELLTEEEMLDADDEARLMLEGKSEKWQTSTHCRNTVLRCQNAYRVLEVISVSSANASLNDSENVFAGSALEEVRSGCMGRRECSVLLELLVNPNTNITEKSKGPLCVNITHRCIVPENTTSFKYLTSSLPCVASGYYPTLVDGRSSQACNSLTISNDSSCGYLQIDVRKLSANTNYMIRVRMRDEATGREAFTFQVLEIQKGSPPKIKISCKVNCNIKTNTRTSFVLQALQINDDETTTILNSSSTSLTWSLYIKDGNARRRRRSTNGEEFIPVHNIKELTATGVNSEFVVIQPHSLIPGMKYRLRITAVIPGVTPGISEIEIKTNLPPYGGRCDVSPKEGISVNDTFTFTCIGWLDEGINVDRTTPISLNEFTLSYQVFHQQELNKPLTLLSFGNNPVISDRYLPSGLPENDYKLFVQIRILDEYGESVVLNRTVLVMPATTVSNDMLQNFTSDELSASNSQDIAQISAAVGSILNDQGSNSSRQGGIGSSTPADDQTSQQIRSNIRSKLVDAVVERINPDSDLDGILQSCSSIGTLVEVATEVDETTQRKATDALGERSASLSMLSQTKSTEDILETASVMVSGLENVVRAARHQVLSNAEEVDPNESVVSLPSFSLKPAADVSSRAIMDESENFLSPEERLEMRSQLQKEKAEKYAKNQEQAKAVGKSAFHSMNLLSDAVLTQKIQGEPSTALQTKGLSIKGKRIGAAELCQHGSSAADDDSLSSILGSSNIQLGNCGGNADEAVNEAIDAELMTMDDNPFIWDESADHVRSSVVSLSLKLSNGSTPFQNSSTSLFRLELPVTSQLSSVPPQMYEFVPSGVDEMSYHEFMSGSSEQVVFLTVKPMENETASVLLRIYFLSAENFTEFPTVENNTFVKELPDFTADPVNPYRIRMNGSDLLENSRYVFGIHQIDLNGNVTSKENMTLTNYTLYTMVTSCRFWNETTEKWETTGCVVSSETDSNKVVCLCNHLTSFGAGFLVAPNPIDFASLGDKLKNLKDNLAVLLTLISLLVLYVFGVVMCRRYDKKDLKKWSVALLMDNTCQSDYFYQVAVHTGWVRDATTCSRVFFILSGENAQTRIRTLADTENMMFSKGSVKTFLMAADEPLGSLICMRIWHDNSGKDSNASWYLDHVVITDLQTSKKFHFICDDWLAVDESDGKIERLLPVAGDTQIGSFQHLFSSSARRDLSDGHLWFSLFSRPTKSHFTRVQRLSCAFALTLTTMLTSAMFFGRDSEDSGQQGRIEIGPISITTQQLMISVQASFIALPVNILLVQIFRRVRPHNGEVHLNKGVRSVLRKTSINAVESEVLGKEDQKKMKTLPPWFIYIAWCLLLVVSACSATFVFLYSVEWGATKANDWLLSITFSFTQSIFVVQPVKVVVVAVLFSFFINRFAKSKAGDLVEDTESVRFDPRDLQQKQEEWLMRCPLDDDLLQDSRALSPNPDELQNARKAREHHKLMIATVQDIITYLLYVILILTAANAAQDAQSYRLHKSITDIFINDGDPLFDDIRIPEDFWTWSDETLLSGLHATDWYNGKRVSWLETRYLSNRETFVIGPARFRQLRVKTDFCSVNGSRTTSTQDCVEEYNIITQETGDFEEFWRPLSNATEQQKQQWKFQSFVSLGGYPYQGLHHWYDGGGYVATMGNTARISRQQLTELKENGWLDRKTAAVFIEFTVYNANVNLFASCVFLLERSPNGVFLPKSSITPIRLYEFIDGKGSVLVAIYVIFVVVLIYKMYQMATVLRVEKRQFFKKFWNVVDFIGILTSVVTIALYAVRSIQMQLALNKVTEDIYKETFINFQLVTLWHDSFRYSLAFILFLATIKFTKLLAFNRRIRLLAYTLQRAAKPILYFTAMFSIYFGAFLFLGYIWFEQKLYPYSTAYLTAEEMFSMLVGRFDFTKLQAADPVLGPIFFTGFVGLCTMVLLNMFMVILDESIKLARSDVSKAQNRFEVVEFIIKQLKNIFSGLVPNSFMKKSGFSTKAKRRDKHLPKSPLEELEKRIDQLAFCIASMEIEFYSQMSIDDLEAELAEAELSELDDCISLSY